MRFGLIAVLLAPITLIVISRSVRRWRRKHRWPVLVPGILALCVELLVLTAALVQRMER